MLALALALAAAPPTFELQLLNPDGSPAAGVSVLTNVIAEAEPRQAQETTRTDKDGRLSLPLPGDVQSVQTFILPEARVPMIVSWNGRDSKDGVELPAAMTVPLTPGATIGGVVLDPDGRPIEGASVQVAAAVPESEKGRFRDPDEPTLDVMTSLFWRSGPAVTDAEGRWSYDNAPPAEDVRFRVSVSHPKFIAPDVPNTAAAAEDLLASRLEVRLRPAVTVTGTVTGPDGRPVSGATVTSREVWFSEEHETVTAMDGTFELGPFPADRLPTLTVLAEGLAPRRIEPARTAPLDIALDAGSRTRVRVLDTKGRAVERAQVRVDGWRRTNLLHPHERGFRAWTDAEGLATIPPLPPGGVQLGVDARGFAGEEVAVHLPSDEVVVRLKRSLKLTGEIVDAATGELIDSARAVRMIAFGDELSVSVGTGAYDDKAGGGRFALTFDRADARHGVMAEAVGYRSAVAGPFAVGDDPGSLTLRMEPSSPLEFVLRSPDGRPASQARAEIATTLNAVELDDLAFWRPETNPTAVQADDAGFVSLPTPAGEAVLVVWHESGCLIRPLPDEEDFGGPRELTLDAWASLDVSTRPEAAGRSVVCEGTRFVAAGGPVVVTRQFAKVDEDGRARFDRRPPGPARVGRYLSVWDRLPPDSAELKSVDPAPGQNVRVRLDDGPASATGRVRLVGDGPPIEDVSYSFAWLVPDAAGDEWKRRFPDDDWADGIAGLRTLTLSADGTFDARGLEPGGYTLAVRVFEDPQGGCLIDPVAVGLFPVVASVDGTHGGEIELERRAVVPVGDSLPVTPAFDEGGQAAYLKPTPGRLTVVDFWASWCAPCRAAMPKFEAMANRHAGDDRVRLLAVNVDETRDAADRATDGKPSAADRLYAPKWFDTEAARQWGVSSLPAYVVLDGEGRLVAREATLEAAAEALRAALAGG